MLFFLLISISCAVDKVEIEEPQTTNPDNVWIYDGYNTVLKNVIEDLKTSEYRESLERRLAKNEVLWQEAKFLLIDNKKRILVPFLSTDKENVIGVLALVKDDKGKITFDMTSRTQLNSKNNKLPFWNKGTWMGYFMALDANILGIKNGNPGLAKKQANDEKLSEMFGVSTAKSLKTCRQDFTGYYATFYALSQGCGETNESTTCYSVTIIISVPIYEEICWDDVTFPEVPPAPTTPDPGLPTNPGYIPGTIWYNDLGFSKNDFLAYVNATTYSISSPRITSTYGEGCVSKVKIVTTTFAWDIEIEQLLNRNSTIPYYYVNGVSSSVSDRFGSWASSSNTDHWIDSSNSYIQNSTSIVEYEGQNRYYVNGGSLIYIVPVKYKIEINSYTGEILSISRVDL